MKAITIIAALVIGMMATAQRPLGLEVYDTVTYEENDIFTGGRYYDQAEDNYTMLVSSDYVKITIKEVTTVTNELDRILKLNGRTLDDYDEYTIGAIEYSLTPENLYAMYKKSTKSNPIVYRYYINEYEVTLYMNPTSFDLIVDKVE